jgi:dihydrofolate synthase / folylpolyglutamate synthase
MRSAADNLAWLESLTPWPEEFGLERMRGLLRALGDPQREYPAIHVVGSNGKTTTTRLAEALLEGASLAVGAYTSPHVVGWAERIRVRGEEADLAAALERVRESGEELGATQFEALTAAALAEFAAAEVDVAVVEAGLGGRLDATNVLSARVVVLTNVALEHTDVLGATREEIAAEKLAVVGEGATVVLGEPEWEEAARAQGAAAVVVAGASNLALALAAVESFLGRTVDPAVAEGVVVPGRLERVRAGANGQPPRGQADEDERSRQGHARRETSRRDETENHSRSYVGGRDALVEIWDGAHNLAAVGWLLARLPSRRYTVVVSILQDKDADGMLAALSAIGDELIATRSSNPRAIAAEDLAGRAGRFFARVDAVSDPAQALATARERAGEDGAILVTGSLYLLADLAPLRPASPVPWRR